MRAVGQTLGQSWFNGIFLNLLKVSRCEFEPKLENSIAEAECPYLGGGGSFLSHRFRGCRLMSRDLTRSSFRNSPSTPSTVCCGAVERQRTCPRLPLRSRSFVSELRPRTSRILPLPYSTTPGTWKRENQVKLLLLPSPPKVAVTLTS